MRSFKSLYQPLMFAVVLTSAAAATAQQAQRGSDEMVLVTHEVGDLVMQIPDYAAISEQAARAAVSPGGLGGGFGGGGGGFGGGLPPGGGFGGGDVGRLGGAAAGADSSLSSVTWDDLIDAITSTVNPDSWAENGGGAGQIQPVATTLVVLQTLDAQEKISHLLDALRSGSAARRSVAIDARWLLLDSDDLERLVQQSDDGKTSLNREALAEFTRQPTSLRALTNCFSGQRVYLISGTRRAVVSGYIPVVGSIEAPGEDAALAYLTSRSNIVWTQFGGEGGGGGGRSVGYQPIVEKPNFGALLEIRPTLMQGDEAAVVDLTSTITFGGPDAEVAAAPAAPLIDRVAVAGQELATTFRVPLGEPTLVGGMSVLGQPEATVDDEAQNAPAQEVQQLYLVLEIR
jgi:hypothetical protein